MRNRFSPTRDFFIPKGALKVADKLSDAVAYLYTTTSGKPAAMVFYGKQSKPAAHYSYASEAKRAERVAAYFSHRQQIVSYKATRRAERSAKPRMVEVGALYYTSWGYDQTNIDFYEVVELVGTKSAKVRKISGMDASNGNEPWMTGKAIPAAGQFKGEAQLVRVTGDAFKVDGNYAHRWDGRPVNWTAYA